MSSIQWSFHLLNARSIFTIFLCNRTWCVGGLSLLLQRYVRRGNDANNPAVLGFFFVIEKTQLNAMHVQLLEKLRETAFAETCQFLTIQWLAFQDIWQKNSSETTWMIYHKQAEFWHRNFGNTENDLRQTTKIAYVKMLLEQCWQKGFNS